MAGKNYYDILEVSPRASDEVVKAAYRALMNKYHPDKSGDTSGAGKNNSLCVKINEAWDVLGDGEKRELYDKQLREKHNLKTIGNYRLISKIAEGGFGTTYKGEHIELEVPVCLKHGHCLSPTDEMILKEEAKAIWDLRHYGIPSIRDLLKLEDSSPVLVMSYVSGMNIEQILNKTDKIDPESVAWITERALNVLMYLHYNGVVHGDVKPQNIIVQPESHNIVLVDYGLSAIHPSKNHSNKGYTPIFASPEQEKGYTLLPESDFYSLGMTMIYALGGDAERRKVPEDVPVEMCDFIRKLIVYDVLSRPNWQKENLWESFQKMRKKAFGRSSTGIRPIPGL